jgi:hypothetical protein
MTLKAFVLLSAAICVPAVPALAHHSFAMFDADKTIELSGTVKEFRWTNPHAWLLIVVMDADGKATQWALEMGAPVGLTRIGWRPRTVVPGDKVILTAHPMKDGALAGQLLSATLPDGRTLGDVGPGGGGG